MCRRFRARQQAKPWSTQSVPKEEVQESLHRYASLSQDQGVTGCDLGAAAPSGCGRFVGSPQAEPV